MAILAHYSGEGDFYRWQVKNTARLFHSMGGKRLAGGKAGQGFGPLPSRCQSNRCCITRLPYSGLFIGSDFGRSPLDAPSGAGHGVVYPAGGGPSAPGVPQTPGGERLAGAVLALSLPSGNLLSRRWGNLPGGLGSPLGRIFAGSVLVQPDPGCQGLAAEERPGVRRPEAGRPGGGPQSGCQ